MTTPAAVESFEIERKYEVDSLTSLPDEVAFRAAGFIASTPVLHHLHATYFDTLASDLAQRRLALRRRRGGKDAGWHLKRKGDGGARELFWPESDTMPDSVLAEVRSWIGDSAEALVPLAELETERTVVVLGDEADHELVELADDRVRALDHRTGLHRAWREWEAEVLGDGSITELDRVEPVLRAAGAVPSLSPAKIARATGRLATIAELGGASALDVQALRRLDVADQEAARRLGA